MTREMKTATKQLSAGGAPRMVDPASQVALKGMVGMATYTPQRTTLADLLSAHHSELLDLALDTAATVEVSWKFRLTSCGRTSAKHYCI